MNGRLENQLKIDKLINEKIKNQPQFIHEYAVQLKQGETRTANVYLNYVLAFLLYLSETGKYDGTVESLSKLLPKDINDYFDKKLQYTVRKGTMKAASASYRGVVWSAINGFYRFLVLNDYATRNPCDGVPRPKQTDYVNKAVLTQEEISSIITDINTVKPAKRGKDMGDVLASRDMLLFLLLIRTGSRITALLEINIEDINEEKKTIHIMGKRRQHINLPIEDDVLECYKQWMIARKEILGTRREDALFINKNGTRLSYNGASKCLSKHWGEIEGKTITPHTTRTTVGTWIYEKTNDIYKVQNALGHKNISTTLRYVKTSDEQNRETMSMLSELTKI